MQSNLRQMPPVAVLDESGPRIGLRVSMVRLAIFADLIPRIAALGLPSTSRMTALGHINACPGCSQADLARHVGLSAVSSMTMVAQLERSGFVERRRGVGRSRALHITSRGRAAWVAAQQCTLENEQKFFGVLDADERATLAALLEKVIVQADARRSKKGED